MEGLEVSEVNLSNILAGAETLRLDSDYYKKRYLKSEALINNNPLSFCKFLDLDLTIDCSAFYPALEPYYNTGNYPFIRVGDVKRHVDFDGCVKVPFGILHNYPTLKHVKRGDIVLTKGGTIGLTGLITQNCCVTRDLIFINSSALSEDEYTSLFLFLSSKFAFEQLVRSSSQSVQPHLTTTLVRDIYVFKLSPFFKKKLTDVYKKSISKIEDSQKLYSQAETLLLSNLGLEGLAHSEENVNVKSLKESFLTTGRLDAEHYQQKFDELDVLIKASNNWDTLENILNYNSRGKQPSYVDNGYPVINSKHVRANKIIVDDLRQATKEDNTVLIEKGDVLINGTGVGTIGRAATYLHDEPAIPDNHVTILRTDKISPLYLSVFLNSLAGQYQVEKYFKGSSGQIELYPDDINKFLIWVATDEIQKEIERTINEAFLLEKQSEQLLETAKRAVEMAIELDEDAALRYIEEARWASI